MVTVNASIEQIQARIGKITYQLTTSDDPQKTRDIAATADAMMKQVAKKSPHLNQTAQAVLALVNAVSMMQESYEKLQAAQADTDLANQTAEAIRAELIRQRELHWQIKKELLYYRNLCEIYETKLSERAEEIDDDPNKTLRRARRGRKLLLGDLQMTFEDALGGSDEREETGGETEQPVSSVEDDF